MPIYKVTVNDKAHLVDAKSDKEAIFHVFASATTSVERLNPRQVADACGGGLKLEVAGETPAPPAITDKPHPQQ